MGAQQMPARFPCWCQATYSWGGETKKDLGFVEGDLIEALNAGDGLWWMGRLRRDPRAIGLFPSNFVKVLDENFQPAPNSRNHSPLNHTLNKPATSTSKSKSVFRKPFDAYEKVGPRGSLEGNNSKEGTPESDREKARREKSKFRPYASMKTAQAPTGTLRKQGSLLKEEAPRIPAPPPRRMHYRNPSRLPSPQSSVRLGGASASPTPTPDHYQSKVPKTDSYRSKPSHPDQRAPSPQPIYHASGYVRPCSPLPATYHDGSAYPQLLPLSRQPSPNPFQQQEYIPRPSSPAPSLGYGNSYRPGSPEAYTEVDAETSSPPPPPPAHRVAYQPSRAPSMVLQDTMDCYKHAGISTPAPNSPRTASNMTPSPLRDAMNDVMSSLQDMSMYADGGGSHMLQERQTLGDVWSPDEFEIVRSKSQQQSRQRAQSSLGFASREQYSEEAPDSLPFSREGTHALGNYVEHMERQLRHARSNASCTSDMPPQPPLKGTQFTSEFEQAVPSAYSSSSSQDSNFPRKRLTSLKHRKSAYELGRTYTTKTNATNSTETSSGTHSSISTQMTSRSIMSGQSAGGFSATSAGSLARRKFGLGSQKRTPLSTIHTRSVGDLASSARSMAASESSGSGPSYHDSHASDNQPYFTPTADLLKEPTEPAGILGGLSAPKARKSGFFKKMIESAKTTARTGAATARSTIGSATNSRPGSRAGSPTKGFFGGSGPAAISNGSPSRPSSSFGGGRVSKDVGLGCSSDWMQVRRDVNRSNSLSRKERDERIERCELLDLPSFRPIEQLHDLAEGDEGLDGLAVTEPTDFNMPNLALVDKSTRFIQSIPPLITATALAQSYICRPHRSDVQRLRAIFTWVAERITWEEDYEGAVDTRRVVSTRRGCSQEIAMLTREMCAAVGLYCEEVHGYLKAPGEVLDLDQIARSNHWWNTVIVDGEWRIMDCSLASPTHPRRSTYSCASGQVADNWYFLARPMEICYTHIPLLPEQQHIAPNVPHEILVALPCATPTAFANKVELADFDSSVMHLENLEMAHIYINVPDDVECVAETEARAYAQDADGDFFERGDMIKKRSFCQAEWVGGRKRFTVKALLPGDEGQGTLKVYAGKRGLMHSVNDNPHSLALALPLSHTGQNPPYEFHVRHPTPHAQRHDLYVAQPQCGRLTLNNTFVFCVRQHPSSLSRFTPDTWGSSAGTAGRPTSPNPYARPSSAMSMVSANISVSGSDYSNGGYNNGQPMTAAQQKPAKLAIQTPSQKIIRLTRKQELSSRGGEEDDGLTTSWETVIKIGEVGTWRGLVLADRSARWCVFAEWECA